MDIVDGSGFWEGGGGIPPTPPAPQMHGPIRREPIEDEMELLEILIAVVVKDD